MSFFYISIFLSTIIGVIIIAWIRSFDIYEKETYTSMMTAFFIGGSTSVLIALMAYRFLGFFGIDNKVINTTPGSLFIIGPVEETAKLTGLIIVFYLIRNRFNEITDGVIYIACVALGFSIIENFFYANTGENKQYLIIYRAFICTPAHISFSVLLGYAWYRYKVEQRSIWIVFTALVIASILHGIFDALAFSPWYNIILLIYLFLIMQQSLRIVQYTNVISPFKPDFRALFDSPSGGVVTDMECPCCKSTAPKTLYHNNYFTACRCDNCGHYITSLKDTEKIFRVFAPEYKKFNRKIVPARFDDNRILPSVYGAAFIDEKRMISFFRVEDVAERLQIINDTLMKRFRRTSLISGDLFKKFFE